MDFGYTVAWELHSHVLMITCVPGFKVTLLSPSEKECLLLSFLYALVCMNSIFIILQLNGSHFICFHLVFYDIL